jgi:hypothetical protein
LTPRRALIIGREDASRLSTSPSTACVGHNAAPIETESGVENR